MSIETYELLAGKLELRGKISAQGVKRGFV